MPRRRNECGNNEPRLAAKRNPGPDGRGRVTALLSAP
jgi:hypothetical protein